MAGYSGTPLVKKLGIKESYKIYIYNAPENYMELIKPIPTDVVFQKRCGKNMDVIHLFSKSKKELSDKIKKSIPCLKSNGMIWISWPKKASKVATDITEDAIRAIALPLDLVDIKVCAVDETWSGLKLVVRKEKRKK